MFDKFKYNRRRLQFIDIVNELYGSWKNDSLFGAVNTSLLSFLNLNAHFAGAFKDTFHARITFDKFPLYIDFNIKTNTTLRVFSNIAVLSNNQYIDKSLSITKQDFYKSSDKQLLFTDYMYDVITTYETYRKESSIKRNITVPQNMMMNASGGIADSNEWDGLGNANKVEWIPTSPTIKEIADNLEKINKILGIAGNDTENTSIKKPLYKRQIKL